MHATFAHPYIIQLLALWLSFLPIAGIAALMAGALVRGDRGFRRKISIHVPVPASE